MLFKWKERQGVRFSRKESPVLATWDIRSTIRQEIVEKKCITTYSLGRWQRKRTDIPGSQHKYPLAI
jgi:hypothetical protein